MTEKDTQDKKWRGIAVAIFLIVALAAVFFWVCDLMKGDEKKISHNQEKISLASLYCTAEMTDDMLFKFTGANEVSQIIKVVFGGNKMDAISYTVDASYGSNDIAEKQSSSRRHDYHNYVGERDEKFKGVSSRFAVIDNRAKIDLYVEASRLNELNAKLFGLSGKSDGDFFDYSDDELKTLYENKGYACKFINN